MNCESCGTYWSPGQAGGYSEDSCPHCGEPYRHQPSPTQSDMHVRNIPGANGGDDMGGNPLQEGMMGGWQNRKVRDESFASSRQVRSVMDNALDQTPYESWQYASAKVEIPATIEKVAPQGMKNEDAEEFMEDDKPKKTAESILKDIGNAAGDVVNGVGDAGKAVTDTMDKGVNFVGDTLASHPWETLGALGLGAGAVLTGGADLALAPEIEGGAAAADAGAEAAGGVDALSGPAKALGEIKPGLKGPATDSTAPGSVKYNTPGDTPSSPAADTPAAQSLWQRAKTDPSGLARSAPGAAMRYAMNKGKQFGMGTMAGMGLAHGVGMGGGLGGGGAGPGGGLQAPTSVDPRNTAPAFSHVRKQADDPKSTPTSHGEIPTNNINDPEQIDPHEKNDDTGHGYFGEMDTNDIGGTASAHHLEEGSPAHTHMVLMMPKIVHYATNGNSGADDPFMQALHGLLEQEIPGYLDHPDHEDEQILKSLVGDEGAGAHQPGEHKSESDSEERAKNSRVGAPMGAPTGVPGAGAPMPGVPGAGATGVATNPQTKSHCPFCGATLDPSSTTCPQCQASVGGMPGHGPYAEAQQQAAQQAHAHVAASPFDPMGGPNEFQYIGEPDIPQGMTVNEFRHDSPVQKCPACKLPGRFIRGSCPNCGYRETIDPNYARVASQGPQTPEQIAAVQQLLAQHGRALKEILDVPVNPDNYARELAEIQKREAPPTGDLSGQPPQPPVEQAPPGATMPVPGMSMPQQSMSKAIRRWAADSIAAKCPKCDSHTTGLYDIEDGKSHCHTCGHTFKTPVEPHDTNSSDSTHTALRDPTHGEHGDHGNASRMPAADQENRLDQGNRDPQRLWKTDDGQSLQEGQQYYLYTAGFHVPDVIQVKQIKPDSIVVEYTGEHGMGYENEISREEMQIEKYRFQPYMGDDQQLGNTPPDSNDDNSAYMGESQSADQSNDHELTMNSALTSSAAWLREEVAMEKTAGAAYTPMEQTDFINERGVARNADKLNLKGTHYEDDLGPEDMFPWGI